MKRRPKDLPPSKPVKGGKIPYSGNDNITLLRGAAPTLSKRDLPARKRNAGSRNQT